MKYALFFIACAGCAMPVFAAPYQMGQTITIPVLADVTDVADCGNPNYVDHPDCTYELAAEATMGVGLRLVTKEEAEQMAAEAEVLNAVEPAVGEPDLVPPPDTQVSVEVISDNEAIVNVE